MAGLRWVVGAVVALGLASAVPAVADPVPWTATTVPTPRFDSGRLVDVSCGGVDSCVAVGSSSPATPSLGISSVPRLASHWDGAAWTAMPLPHFSGWGSAAVDCPEADVCLAVFGGGPTGLEPLRFDGVSWTVMPARIPAAPYDDIESIDCLTDTDCTAVGVRLSGSDRVPLTLHWDGTGWSARVVTLASPNGDTSVSAVACASPGVCFAVGHTAARQLLLAGNGNQWRPVSVPKLPGDDNVGSYDGIACPSATSCVAVGSRLQRSRPFVARLLRWDGTTWSPAPTPDPDLGGTAQLSGSALVGIACTAVDACEAVGQDEPKTPDSGVSYAQRWDGTSWTVSRFADPPTGSAYLVRGVDCVDTACVTVGNHRAEPPTGQVPVSEVDDGSGWHVVATPTALSSPAPGYLRRISCVSDTACVAAGAFVAPAGGGYASVATWNGVRWATVQPGPMYAFLTDVSCTGPRACLAVSSSADATAGPKAARLDGSTWTLSTPSGGTLEGVSCVTAHLCFAAGDNGGLGVVQRWTPAGWSVVLQTPVSERTQLSDLSCVSATACAAVGSATTDPVTHATAARVETWDGVSWRRVAVPLPAGSSSSWLTAVSCAPTRCTAVGTAVVDRSLVGFAVGQDASGTWRRQAGPASGGADRVVLNDVSCSSDTSCTAVGQGGPQAAAYVQTWDGTRWTADPSPPATGALTGVSCGTTCRAVASSATVFSRPEA